MGNGLTAYLAILLAHKTFTDKKNYVRKIKHTLRLSDPQYTHLFSVVIIAPSGNSSCRSFVFVCSQPAQLSSVLYTLD